MNGKDCVIWVTGASSGIGEACAREFAAKGAYVILSARRTPLLEKVRQQLPDPEKGLVLALDLEDRTSFEDKVSQALKWRGRIDVLFLNAGISQRSKASETAIEVDERLMMVNYIANVHLTKCVLPIFHRQKSGHIAVVTSLVGKFGSPLRSGYAASKHALHGFFDSLRAEESQNGIKITLICPGYIHTDVSMNALTGDGRPQQSMDEKTAQGLSPKSLARKVTKALQNNRLEVYIGQNEVYGVYLKRFFPSLFARILNKAKVT